MVNFVPSLLHGSNERGIMWPSNTSAGTIYMAGMFKFQADAAKYGISKSTDSGNTWTWLGATVGDISPYYVLPFADNAGTPYADDTRAWRSSNINGMGAGVLVRSSTTFPGPFNPTDWTDKSAGVIDLSWLMDICTWNEDYQYVLADSAIPAAYSTNDQAVNWTSSGTLGGVSYYALSALPYNRLFCAIAGPESAGAAGKVYRTLDGGTAWVDATGDLNTALASITSMRSIVPDWIKVT